MLGKISPCRVEGGGFRQKPPPVFLSGVRQRKSKPFCAARLLQVRPIWPRPDRAGEQSVEEVWSARLKPCSPASNTCSSKGTPPSARAEAMRRDCCTGTRWS